MGKWQRPMKEESEASTFRSLNDFGMRFARPFNHLAELANHSSKAFSPAHSREKAEN